MYLKAIRNLISNMPNIYHFYNEYHYGDNILNLKFLNNISPYLEKEDIIIYYYYNNSYITNVYELTNYIHTDRIKLDILINKPHNSINLWMEHFKYLNNISYNNFDIYFNLYYKNILSLLKLEKYEIDTSIYQQENYLTDKYNKLDNKYKDIDILILNSVPFSKQYNYNKSDWDNMCIFLNTRYNIVTTSYVNDSIKCTYSDNLSIQEIGAISTHCKYIIGVHSGPMTGCYNITTKNNVIQWFIFENNNNIIHNDIDVINNSTIESVLTFFK